MRLNVVPAALGRLAASLIALFALALPAAAADRALINMLGYSADGNEFAFEQFGNDVRRAFVIAYVIDRQDIRVIERACGPRFLLEAM